MPTEDDIRYGNLAVEKEYISREKLAECLEELEERWEKVSLEKSLCDLLIDKGLISLQQANELLRLQGKEQKFVKGYSIIGVLGRGGLGVVYKARQDGIGRIVALKVMAADLVNNPDYVQRFMMEAKLSGQLDHPNIVRAIDFGESQGIYYYAMEFVRGRTLKQIVETEGPLAEERAVEIFCQMADALKHSEDHGLVHRDIKPDNIIINTEGLPKLCDLGLAKSIEADNLALTQSGIVVGTPYYISPEQAMGEELDVRSDIYSLGVTMYHVVTGHLPYTGTNAMNIISKHLTEPFPDPRSTNPNISPALADVILKMVAKKPSERYQRAQELIVDLERLRKGTTPVVTKRKTKVKPENLQPMAQDVTQQLGDYAAVQVAPPEQPPGDNLLEAKPTHDTEDKVASAAQRAALVENLQAHVRSEQATSTLGSPSPGRKFLYRVLLLIIVGALATAAYHYRRPLIEMIKTARGTKSQGPASGCLQTPSWLDKLVARDHLAIFKERQARFQKELAALQPAQSKPLAQLTADMVLIPAGSAIIGNAQGHWDELPVKTIKLPAFWIDRYEVSNQQYSRFCKATGHAYPAHWPDKDGPPGQANYPVVGVSWYDAVLYATWIGKRLPTEIEWERAARGTQGKIYPWGILFEMRRANVANQMLEPVDSHACGKSTEGVYNMAGNAWEWTASHYLDSIEMVIRGGSYLFGSFYARASYRDGFFPWGRRCDVGFRCALSVNKR